MLVKLFHSCLISHMSAYFAPAFFSHLLGKYLRRKIPFLACAKARTCSHSDICYCLVENTRCEAEKKKKRMDRQIVKENCNRKKSRSCCKRHLLAKSMKLRGIQIMFLS